MSAELVLKCQISLSFVYICRGYHPAINHRMSNRTGRRAGGAGNIWCFCDLDSTNSNRFVWSCHRKCQPKSWLFLPRWTNNDYLHIQWCCEQRQYLCIQCYCNYRYVLTGVEVSIVEQYYAFICFLKIVYIIHLLCKHWQVKLIKAWSIQFKNALIKFRNDLDIIHLCFTCWKSLSKIIKLVTYYSFVPRVYKLLSFGAHFPAEAVSVNFIFYLSAFFISPIGS